ncbi:MAG: peptide chain release factor 2 [Candidatus Moranbacteria bacterium]|nr:peptide chain release factor 2 [Candidatus Moranbacteria bacterium]
MFDLNKLKKETVDLRLKLERENVWRDQRKARSLSVELKDREDELFFWEEINNKIADLKEEQELLESIGEKDKDYQKSIFHWEQEVANVLAELREKEILLTFSGKYDRGDAALAIRSGAGGTDAQDFAEMLLRMYLKYLEQKGFEAKIIDKSLGKEAGIKSAELQIKGKYAYGYLKGEHGIHRLVRLSPFNVAKTRETSFVSVEVVPLIPDNKLEVSEKDLKIDTFRAGGPGGQHVNTTSSAVRVTHIPTNITVVCQNERSQMQNKQLAMQILKAKVFRRLEEERQKNLSDLRGERKEAAFGHQIRSYVLHPYTMVKDHRSGFSISDVNKVLNGNLDELIKKYLEWNAGSR